jgi:formylmethanofuran dehydrogenase subunit E
MNLFIFFYQTFVVFSDNKESIAVSEQQECILDALQPRLQLTLGK